MPIEGLTNRTDQGRFTEIGQLRKGDPKGDNRPGKDLEYFRFTTGDQHAAQAFARTYGDKANNILVYLPYPTVDENLFAFRELWTGSRLLHRCDGNQTWERNAQGQLEPTGQPCPTAGLPERHKDKCRPAGRLTVIVDCLRRFAYVSALTTSIHDIANLSAEIAAIQSIAGNLQGIPMLLSRRPQSISAPKAQGSTERQRITKWLMHIEIDPTWAERRLLAQRQAAELAWNEPAARLLPGPAMQVVNMSTGELLHSAPIDDGEDSDDEGDPAHMSSDQPDAHDVDEDEIWIEDAPDSSLNYHAAQAPDGPAASFDPIDSDPRQQASAAKESRRAEAAAAPLGTFEERTMAANADLLGVEDEAPQRPAGMPQGRRTAPAPVSQHESQRAPSLADKYRPDNAPETITAKMITDGWREVNERWAKIKMPEPEHPDQVRKVSSQHWGIDLAKSNQTRMRKLWDQIGLYLRQADKYEAETARQNELPL